MATLPPTRRSRQSDRHTAPPAQAARVRPLPDTTSLKSVATVPVERLVLDRRNPRLVSVDGDATDEEIIAQLYRAEDLGELLQSISANGYMDIEPLIVLEQDGDLVVLEGNRRLAAIRLFREPDLAARVSERRRIRIRLPDITDRYRRTLDRVSVYRVAEREDARSFIGFKHINGAAKWESYAKARFAADWYRGGGVSLADVADRIGDRHEHDQAHGQCDLRIGAGAGRGCLQHRRSGEPRFNFSHLYTALSRAPYMRFLGLDTAWAHYDPSPDPVPDDGVSRLSEVLKWIYGSQEDGADPVVQSQNPDIKHLGEVLASAEGLAVLRTTGSLSDAHASIRPADRRFSESLLRARQEIREASNSLRGFDGRDESMVGIAEDVSETAQTILDRMKKKVRDTARENE